MTCVVLPLHWTGKCCICVVTGGDGTAHQMDGGQ
jgi:hypothetical protein